MPDRPELERPHTGSVHETETPVPNQTGGELPLAPNRPGVRLTLAPRLKVSWPSRFVTLELITKGKPFW